MRRVLIVFLLGSLWFLFLTSWSTFADPDAFYHAKMASLIWQHGPIHDFPWLDLTTLGRSFADQHFFFHVIEAPFVAVFGWAMGARLTAIILSAIFLTTCFGCLKWLRVRYAEAWITLLAFTQPLLVRLLLGKATPLALTLFVFGLCAAWKRRPLLVGIASVLFALSHGGWVFFLGSLGLMMIGDALYQRVVEDVSWHKIVFSSLWRELIAGLIGVVIGVLLHPNASQLVSLLWIQIVKIGLGTPFIHVILGNEWLPSSPTEVLAAFAPWAIVLIVGLIGLVFAHRKPIESPSARASIAFAFPVAALLAMTLKSRRNVEYFAPAVMFWISWIWTMVDPQKLFEFFRNGFSPSRWRIVFGAMVVVVVGLLGKGVFDAHQALHRETYPDAVYHNAMRPISERANPGDRVFHSDWDEFPVLFNLDDRLRYVAGLDPTFLYEASSTLSNAYREVTWGKATTTREQLWDLIHDRLGARFVFIDKRDHTRLFDEVKTDARFVLLADTPEAVTFEVVP